MKKHVVILGASIVANNVMSTLVKNDFDGKITIIDKKSTFPYNPYKLSKDWMQDLEKTNPPLLKKEAYYKNHNIDLKLNSTINAVDLKTKTITYNNDNNLSYDTLVIALGSKLRKLDTKANNLLYLRTYQDALKIKEKVKTSNHITIIGGGFITLELAASFRQLNKEVSVILRGSLPFEKVFGEKVGKYILEMHQNHGVNFITNDEADQFIKDENDNIKTIITKNSKTINTDLVVAGIGVNSNTDLFKDQLEVDHGIIVDKYLKAQDDVYVGGDVAMWPYNDKLINVSHWEVAYSQGINIANNILNNDDTPYDIIPYFWSDQYDQTFEYLGNTRSFDNYYIRGDLSLPKFTIAYTDKNNVPLAILFANHSEKRKTLEKLIKDKEPLDIDKFTNVNFKL